MATAQERYTTSSPFRPLLLALLFFFAGLVRGGEDRVIALTTSTAFLVQRTCVQSCIWNNGYHDLPVALSCPYPGSDACLCRSDLIPSATNFLSSCVSTACLGNTVDVSSAISLWTRYCSGDDSALFTYAPLATIVDDDGFKAQRGCVQSCIWDNGYRDLNIAMKCGYHWYDACLCRDDLKPIAQSFLKSCVNSACSGNAGDISAAISVSSAYCVGAAKALETATAGGGGGGGGGNGGSGATPGSFGSTGGPTATSTSTANGGSINGGSSSSSMTNLPLIIGIAIAVVVGIGIISAAIIVMKRRRNQPRMQKLQEAQSQFDPSIWSASAASSTAYSYGMQPPPSSYAMMPTSSHGHSPSPSGMVPPPPHSGYSEDDEERDLVPSMQPSTFQSRGMRERDDDASSVFSRVTRGSNPAHYGAGPA